jgi:hypothetical protein
MANFVQVGSRAINLDLVCGVHREQGKLTIYFNVPAGNQPFHWTVTDPKDVEALWVKLAGRGRDLSSVEGGPHSITDNEATASRQP